MKESSVVNADWLAAQTNKLTAEERARFVASLRSYYESLPPEDRPENWADIQEEFDERDAIQHASREAEKNKSIFRVLER